jgi:hypothetical protein
MYTKLLCVPRSTVPVMFTLMADILFIEENMYKNNKIYIYTTHRTAFLKQRVDMTTFNFKYRFEFIQAMEKPLHGTSSVCSWRRQPSDMGSS